MPTKDLNYYYPPKTLIIVETLHATSLQIFFYSVYFSDEARQQFEYDAAGNQTAFIDENGNRTEYEYDKLNRLVQTTYAKRTTDEASQRIEYDEAGNQIVFLDEKGNR